MNIGQAKPSLALSLYRLIENWRHSSPPQSQSKNWHPHMGEIGGKTLDEVLRDLPSFIPIRQTLILATTERTGSEWLCEMMIRTAVLGRPSEYINHHWIRQFIADFPEDAVEQVRLARRFGTTGNGIFSIKMHPWHFDRLPDDINFCEQFPNPKFIFLRRTDILSQAISLVRARQTKSYHAFRDAEIQPTYNAEEITAALLEITNYRSRWERFFARNGLSPLEITYENLDKHPRRAIKSIAQLAGVTIPFQPWRRTVSMLTKQRDGISQQWRQRFLDERGDLTFLDPL